MSDRGTVLEDVEALAGLNIDALREAWRHRFRDEPPALRSGDLMRKFLAERIQVEAFGLDSALQRDLDRLVRNQRAGRQASPQGPRLKAGALLVREWQGKTHRVEVTADGYLWNGEHHASLSVIARAITGSRWNGPRFFGLRDKSAGEAKR